MKFEQFLTRADDELLQQLLGAKALRLLRALDPIGFTQARQRALLLEQSKPQHLLAKTATRTPLLELLRPSEAEQLCQLIGAGCTSPYEALASATFAGDRFNALLDYFELPSLDEVVLELPPATHEVQPAYGLFTHQARAARRAIAKLRSGSRRVLLHMPTGAGKTRTAMHIIAEQLREFPEKSVVWLAHSEELCEQAAAEFEKAWSSLGSHKVQVKRFWGARDLAGDSLNGDFVVAGLPKMNATVRRDLRLVGQLGSASHLVIMDEAHQAIAPTYQLILEALVDPFPGTSLLGLSATPGRTWNDLDADEKLANFFDRQKVMLEIEGYNNPVEYLIDNGYLAHTTFRSAFLESGIVLSDRDRSKIEHDLEIPNEVLERLAEDEVRNLGLLAEIERMVRRHQRIIVFATTVQHSDLLAYTLRARGHWAKSVTGTTPAGERLSTLQDFKATSDEPRIICNFGVLTTGFDAPQTSAALIARPTVSLVLYSQMVGRAIRGPRAGGNANAEIVTVVDRGLPGFGDVGEAFLNWEDIWGSE